MNGTRTVDMSIWGTFFMFLLFFGRLFGYKLQSRRCATEAKRDEDQAWRVTMNGEWGHFTLDEETDEALSSRLKHAIRSSSSEQRHHT